MIISRYLLKEVMNTTLAITFVLLLIFISQQLLRFLSYAAAGKIPSSLLIQIIEFEIPTLLALLLPAGLYLGIILGYGRLYADNELTVMHACGLGMQRLLLITCILATVITTVVLILMLWINPTIADNKQKILSQTSMNNLISTLMPGRFQVTHDGKRVAYVEKISRTHQKANNLFFAEQKKMKGVNKTINTWTILSANNGEQITNPTTHQSFVFATDGYRYEGIPGQNDFKIIQFKKYTVRVPDITVNSTRQIQEAIATKQLLKHYHNPDNAAELQWRISIPLSALVLAFLAIPLSQVRPRYGRYSMLLPAILLYVIYVNLLFGSRNLIEQKWISTTIGLWWVHIVILMIALLLMLFQRYRKI